MPTSYMGTGYTSDTAPANGTGKAGKMASVLGPCHLMGDPDEALAPCFGLGPTLILEAIWGVYQQIDDILSLSLSNSVSNK